MRFDNNNNNHGEARDNDMLQQAHVQWLKATKSFSIFCCYCTN